MVTESQKPKVVVVGAGWAGLGATYHLAKQGYDVTLLEAGSYPGGLVAGWKTEAGRSVEAGIHGFWYPYKNIFSLVRELGINPFTPFTRSSQYSPACGSSLRLLSQHCQASRHHDRFCSQPHQEASVQTDARYSS